MPLLRHIGSTFPGGYSSAHVDPWPVGVEREVSPIVGYYLLSTFPMAFVEVAAIEPDDLVRPGDQRAGPFADAAHAVVAAIVAATPAPVEPHESELAVDLREGLDHSVPEIGRALAEGVYDQHLGQLRMLEREGRARKGVLEAIDARTVVVARLTGGG